jgi:arylsulfatase
MCIVFFQSCSIDPNLEREDSVDFKTHTLSGIVKNSYNKENVTAYITCDEKTKGVIFSEGDSIQGQSLFIIDGKLKYTLISCDICWPFSFKGDINIPLGDVKITMSHSIKEYPSYLKFYINDELIDSLETHSTYISILDDYKNFDIGEDKETHVTNQYTCTDDFKFTKGQLHKVIFNVEY